MSTANTIDTARLNLLLNELRLPAIKVLWPQFAEQSDKEGWPAARFLATIAEHEIAERGRRRVERHLVEARLPAGKTFDNFDFEAVPMISKAQVTALAAGDGWLGKGANLLLFGPPGGGKSHLAAAIGLALIENGWRVLFTRTTDLVQKLQVARRELNLEAAINRLDRFDLLICDDLAYVTRPGRDQRAVRAHQRSLRAAFHADHRQSALWRVEQGLPGSCYDARRHRSPRSPRHHRRDERRKLSQAHRARAEAWSRATILARDTKNTR
jgi:DNA replication protein DnaC